MGTPLEYPYIMPPAPGESLEVVEGVYWLRFPLPFALDHVNIWLIADEDGWFLIDTGANTRQSRQLWRQLLPSTLGGKPLRNILVTHYHPDHLGHAAWLQAQSGATVLATASEVECARLEFDKSDVEAGGELAELYLRHGLDRVRADQLKSTGNGYRRLVGTLFEDYHTVVAGSKIPIGGREWTIITGNGHSPEHACLYCPELALLIAGDQVLPRISSNISINPGFEHEDPLADYLNSLKRFLDFPDETLVAPGHGLFFRGLHVRLRALLQHHAEKLDVVINSCSIEGATAADLLRPLFGNKLNTHTLRFAMGESIAHLEYARRNGLLERQTTDGVFRYQLIS